MSRFDHAVRGAILGLCLATTPALAQSTGYSWTYGFGKAASADELAAFAALSAQPDGRGLPPGSGSYEAGKKVFAEQCAACHADGKGIGGALTGGRGSLATDAPVKTVESYWPYASTLFDYIKRAMPFNAPGNLSNDDVYAVTAYILGEANILPKTAVMDPVSLPKVAMPNRNGFVPDPRPEIELYR